MTDCWRAERLGLLSEDEERALAHTYRDTKAPRLEERLVRSQLRLVLHLTRAYRVDAADREDLVQQGALGVVEAVRRFDPDRGVRLSSYATWWIRAYQLRYLMANHRLVRVGRTRTQRALHWSLRRERARVATGDELDCDKLADALGVPGDEVSDAIAQIEASEVSLEHRYEGDRTALGAQLPTELPGPAELVERRQLIDKVRAEAHDLCDELVGRERTLFTARFRSDAESLTALGQRFGISRERVRQVESRLFARLRQRVEERLAM